MAQAAVAAQEQRLHAEREMAMGGGRSRAGGGVVQAEIDNEGMVVQRYFLHFLETFTKTLEGSTAAPHAPDEDGLLGLSQAPTQQEYYPYEIQVQDMKDNDHTTLMVDFADVLTYKMELAEAIRESYYRCVQPS